MTAAQRSMEEEEAAFWFARMRSDRISRADREAFLSWLNEDPANSEAYADCQAIWGELGEAAGDDVVLRMRREALSIAPPRHTLSWRGAGLIAASLALVLLGGLAWLNIDRLISTTPRSVLIAEAAGPQVLRTAVGERSAITLQDGSVVELNTDSVALVELTPERRNVRLVRGQALFQVAPDSKRPFVVEAAGKRIVALGTAFDVRLDPDGLQVTLIEGRISVEQIEDSKADLSGAAKFLEPGEQLVARADRPTVVLPADVQREVSWRTGRLVFSNEPLGEVIGEINRYSTHKVVMADPGLTELRVSGVFRVGSTRSFVTALDAAFPIEAHNRGDELVLTWE